MLLSCGAAIQEINAVRKHISAIKGGRLATYIHPAEIVNLTISDVIGDWDALDCITGPTVQDTSTFHDAKNVLKSYELWERVPQSVKVYLSKNDGILETVKAFKEIHISTFMLATNRDACEAAKKRAEELGFNATILSTMIEGESREAGRVLAGIAREVEKNRQPLKPPCVLISGGETTVTLTGENGRGGPNQEFALSASLKIQGSKRITVMAIGTDGTDGPTDIAGGVVDGSTMDRARQANVDVFCELRRHNSSYVLKELCDAVYTNLTGTNVMDLHVMVITGH
jgi:glycerate-2-kinase